MSFQQKVRMAKHVGLTVDISIILLFGHYQSAGGRVGRNEFGANSRPGESLVGGVISLQIPQLVAKSECS